MLRVPAAFLGGANVFDLNVDIHVAVEIDFVLLVKLLLGALCLEEQVWVVFEAAVGHVVGHQVRSYCLLPQVLSLLLLWEVVLL